MGSGVAEICFAAWFDPMPSASSQDLAATLEPQTEIAADSLSPQSCIELSLASRSRHMKAEKSTVLPDSLESRQLQIMFSSPPFLLFLVLVMVVCACACACFMHACLLAGLFHGACSHIVCPSDLSMHHNSWTRPKLRLDPASAAQPCDSFQAVGCSVPELKPSRSFREDFFVVT